MSSRGCCCSIGLGQTLRTPWLLCRCWKLWALLLLCWALQPLVCTPGQPVELCCLSSRPCSVHQVSRWSHWVVLLLPSLKGQILSAKAEWWSEAKVERKENLSFPLLCCTTLETYFKFYRVWWNSLSILSVAIILLGNYSFPSSKTWRGIFPNCLCWAWPCNLLWLMGHQWT